MNVSSPAVLDTLSASFDFRDKEGRAGKFWLIESFDLAAHVINIFAEKRCHDGTGEPLAPILTPGISLCRRRS